MTTHAVSTRPKPYSGTNILNGQSLPIDSAASSDTSARLGAAVFAGRMLLGFTFLWAFVDKLFGLG
jgi:hypothetical protein